MRVRLVLAAATVLGLAACSSDTTTGPQQMQPKGASRDDITCRSGYHVATREDGTQYCEADSFTASAP
jgi:uncharacterized lipoprotein